MEFKSFIATANLLYLLSSTAYAGPTTKGYPDGLTERDACFETVYYILSLALQRNILLFHPLTPHVNQQTLFMVAHAAADTILKNESFYIKASHKSFVFHIVLKKQEISCIPIAPYKTKNNDILPDMSFYTELLLCIIDSLAITTFACGPVEYVSQHLEYMHQ